MNTCVYQGTPVSLKDSKKKILEIQVRCKNKKMNNSSELFIVNHTKWKGFQKNEVEQTTLLGINPQFDLHDDINSFYILSIHGI